MARRPRPVRRLGIRPHHFIGVGDECIRCPLPRENTRGHIPPLDPDEVEDRTEPRVPAPSPRDNTATVRFVRSAHASSSSGYSHRGRETA